MMASELIQHLQRKMDLFGDIKVVGPGITNSGQSAWCEVYQTVVNLDDECIELYTRTDE